MLINRILLLEADKAARETAHAQLTNEHFEVNAPAVPDSFPDGTKKYADLVIASVECLQGLARQTAEELLKRSGLLMVTAQLQQFAEALEWVERGAVEYLLKPFDWPQMRAAIIKADRALRCSLARRANTSSVSPSAVLPGSSPATAELRQNIRNLARTEASVLIQGEPGAGHRQAAAALHAQSSRGSAPFLSVDCAGTNAADLRDELFGNRICKVLIASGGTLLLEEVSQLDLPLQEKLLRFCQSGVVECGNRTVPADVRIVATSSTPLEPRTKTGTFREDLFFRLDMARLDLPPLRERVQDISEIATLYREYYTRKYGQAALALSPEAQLALAKHDWPGNLRELEQTIERAVLRCGANSIISPEHLGLPGTTAAAPLIDNLAEVEKQHILAVLERCDGNRTHAAARLDISIRTLRNKLREFRLAAAA